MRFFQIYEKRRLVRVIETRFITDESSYRIQNRTNMRFYMFIFAIVWTWFSTQKCVCMFYEIMYLKGKYDTWIIHSPHR